ncbi:MAG: peptidyl-prolyl cis-trans isomerase [Acidobacteriota bacterium]
MLKLMRENLKNLKWILWFVVLIFVLLIFVDWGAGRGRSRGMEGVAARVGKTAISEAQFLKELRATEERYRNLYGQQYEQLRNQLDIASITVQNLIDRELLIREAGKLGLGVSDRELLDKIISYPAFRREDGSFVGEQLYARILRSNQMSPEEFEAGLRRDLLIEKLQQALQAGILIPDAGVEREYRRRNEAVSGEVIFIGMDKALERASASDADVRVYYDAHQDRFSHSDQRKLHYLLVDSSRLRRTLAVSDAQIAEYYRSHTSEFSRGEEVRARHILVRPKTQDDGGWREAQTQAREAWVKAMAQPAEFAALARGLSEDTGSKSGGGDLGWFGRGRMTKEFEDAVFALKDGEVSGPVKSEYGFHIIKLEGRQTAGARPLDEVRTQVREKLAESLADAEGSRRASALKEKIDAAKLATEEQWRALADDVVTSNVTPFFAKSELIPGLGRDPELVGEVAEAKEGFVGGPRRSARGWVIYRVAQVRKAGTTPFDEAKDDARETVKRGKAVELLRAELEARRGSLLGGSLESQAATLGGTFQALNEHRRGNAVPGVGASQPFEDALFATAAGALTPVIAVGERGVAIGRVTSKKTIDAATFAKEKGELKVSMAQDELQQLLGAMLAEAKRESAVSVNNDVVGRFKRQS